MLLCRILKLPLSQPLLRMTSPRQWVSYYNGPETDVEEICQQFSQFEAGKIELTQDQDSGIATITINHPERKNALSGSMMVQLRNIVNTLEEWKEGKGVILHSVGDMFCSGGDLNTVRQISNPDDGYKMSTLMHHSLTRLHQLPLVSVALIQGKAIGGGAELATACDYRLFTTKGEIGFVQGKMGVVTGWGGGSRLVHLVGRQKALDLLLTSKQLSAIDAVDMGIANEIIKESSEPLEETRNWLLSRLNHTTEIVHALKQIVATASTAPIEASLKNERSIFAMLWGGDANKKALRQNIKHK